MGNGSEPADFDLNDFRRQLLQIKRMGSFRDIMKLIPGLGSVLGGAEALDADLGGEIERIQGIIDSMTAEERANPGRIDPSRRRRIAAGAGVCNTEVVSLIKQFEIMAAMVKQMASMTTADKVRALNGLGTSDVVCPESRHSLTTPASDKPPPHRERQSTGEAHPFPVEVRHLKIDQPMSLRERETLRRLWEVLARNGRKPSGEEPWFSHWNRNLCLWDFVADE